MAANHFDRMKSPVRALLSSVGLLAALAASAAPNPALVSADARWLVHADLDALRTTVLGQELVAALAKAQSGAPVGLDAGKLLRTVGHLTAYGSNLTPDPSAMDGALIAQGTPELRQIAESALLQGTLAEPKVFAEDTTFPFPAYSISDPKAPAGKRDDLRVYVAFPPGSAIIVGKSRAQLLKAHDVLRGAAPSLASAAASPLRRFVSETPDAYLFAATVVPTENVFPENAPQTRLLRLANSGALALGERGENIVARVELVASSGANAEKLAKILQGMTAALSLAETSDKHLSEFIQAATVARAGDTVKLDLAYSSARLGAMVQSLRTTMEKPAAAPQPAPIVSGRPLAEWSAAPGETPAGDSTDGMITRTIEHAELKNGATITLGWRQGGGRGIPFKRVEITPAQGGPALVFRPDTMRVINVRGAQSVQLLFPGADGAHTLKVAYVDDPARRTAYAVSVRDPRPAASENK
mgnify:CR=1 FL=1